MIVTYSNLVVRVFEFDRRNTCKIKIQTTTRFRILVKLNGPLTRTNQMLWKSTTEC